MTDFTALTGYGLSIHAAVTMWGPSPSHGPSGDLMYYLPDTPAKHRAVTRNYDKLYSAWSFRPDLSADDCNEFAYWFAAQCDTETRKIPINLVITSRAYQHPSAPPDIYPSLGGPIALVGQATLYRAVYLIGPAHFHAGSHFFEHEDLAIHGALLVATLKACEGLGIRHGT